MSTANGTPLRLLLLGPVDLRLGDVSLPIGGEKARSVLALLGLAAGRVVSVETLVDGLWGDEPPGSAANALQYHVSVLRRAVSGVGAVEALRTRPPGYLLEVETDLADFSADVARAQGLAQMGRTTGDSTTLERAASVYSAALERWRGPALADLTEVPFAASKATALESARLAAVQALVEIELDTGDCARWIPRLEELVTEHPTHEHFWAQLMTALYRTGQQAGALATYRRAHRLLDDELGVEPSPILRQLHARVLAQDPSLASPAPRPSRGAGARPPSGAAVRGVTVSATRVRARPRSAAGLLVLTDGRRVPVDDRPLVVGRHPTCDVVLDDVDVSRRHAEIGVDAAAPGHVVRDLGSTNGSSVNGHPVTSVAALHDGDRIEVGTTVLRYEAVRRG